MKALLKHNRQSPRKVRLVADMVRGKDVREAKTILKYTPKKATKSISKVLDSAISNAKENDNQTESDLYIKEIRIDKGFVMKRARPRAFGRAFPINKRTSNIFINLDRRQEGTENKKDNNIQTKGISSGEKQKSENKSRDKKMQS